MGFGFSGQSGPLYLSVGHISPFTLFALFILLKDTDFNAFRFVDYLIDGFNALDSHVLPFSSCGLMALVLIFHFPYVYLFFQ